MRTVSIPTAGWLLAIYLLSLFAQSALLFITTLFFFGPLLALVSFFIIAAALFLNLLFALAALLFIAAALFLGPLFALVSFIVSLGC